MNGNQKFKKQLDTQRCEIVGRIIKYLRLKYGHSQKEIAEKMGIAHQTYSGYETGKHEPNIETLVMLAAFYDVSTDFLTGRYFRHYDIENEAEYLLQQMEPYDKLKVQDNIMFFSNITKDKKAPTQP